MQYLKVAWSTVKNKFRPIVILPGRSMHKYLLKTISDSAINSLIRIKLNLFSIFEIISFILTSSSSLGSYPNSNVMWFREKNDVIDFDFPSCWYFFGSDKKFSERWIKKEWFRLKFSWKDILKIRLGDILDMDKSYRGCELYWIVARQSSYNWIMTQT